MTQTGARAIEGAEQALSPLRRQDLPSFLVALPAGRILEATQACAALGIHAGALAPAAVRADALRLRGAARFGFARLRLPGLFTPRLFRCAPLALPGGMAVLFADPAAFAAEAGTPSPAPAAGAVPVAPSGAPAAARLAAPPVPVALRPLFAQPVRITFETDAAGHVVSLSPLLADALGARAALFTGRSFAAIEADGLMDGGAALAEALAGGSFSELKARVAPRTADETALDLTLGGVPVFDAARRRTGTRGFGILSAALAQPQPPARPRSPAPAPPAPRASDPRISAPLGENVVPLRAGTLSPQERSAFREIARTLAAAIEDWPKPGPAGAPPASDPDATVPPLPLLPAAETEEEAPSSIAPDADGATEAGPHDFELLDRLPLGLMVLQDGHARFINRTLLDWTGHADLADAEDSGGLDAMLVREGADLLLVAADGGRRPVDVRLVAAPFLGRPALLHVIRPQAEGHNRQDRAAARREAIDMVPWPVFLLEPEGAIRLANAAAAARIGFEAADLAGEPFTIAIAPQDRAAAVAALDAAAGGAPSVDLSLTLRHRDGTLCSGRAGITRAGADGQLLCVVIGPEAPAAPAPDGLPHVARRLNAALAAPLGRLAAADCPPQEAREARASLAATLDDLARLGEDAPAAAPTPCDLAALVREAADQIAPAARRRRVALRRDLADGLTVTADAPRLARLVRLLLEDALEATPAGAGIALSLGRDADGAWLQVSDGGPALDEVALAAALDPARDAADASRFDAAGRPLRLARLARDAAGLGGRLSVRPDLTHGMTVRLDLPG